MNKPDNSEFIILIVDDIPKNLQVLGNNLHHEGYKVEFATDGQKALDWIKQKEFDLILLDIMMPGMNGFEVCKRIREGNKNANVPIIFLTAKTDRESVLQGYDLGAQDYVTKPFDARELLARVKTHLELKSSREELEHMNRILEEKVKERTRELAEVNNKLEQFNTELVDIDAAKSEFLNVVSQKIRKPLVNIHASVHVLKNKVETKELTDLVNTLDESVLDLEKFTTIAVQITAFRTKKQRLEQEEISLRQVLEFSFLKASESIKQKEIAFDFSGIKRDMKISGDSDLLMTCFRYLFEKIAEGSSSADIIEVLYEDSDGRKSCRMKNKGKGFSEQVMQEITDISVGVTHDFTSDSDRWELLLSNLILESHSGGLETRQDQSEIIVFFKSN